jgi:hypothetical protein
MSSALAGFVTTATLAARRAGMAPTWVCLPAAVLVPLLPVGGTAFLMDSPILTGVLTASLPLLLLWTAAITIAVTRCANRTALPGPARNGPDLARRKARPIPAAPPSSPRYREAAQMV